MKRYLLLLLIIPYFLSCELPSNEIPGIFPEIAVFLESGTDTESFSYDFGNIHRSSVSDEIVFTIHNTGSGKLSIYDVNISDISESDIFNIVKMPQDEISSQQSSELSISFTPKENKVYTATLKISSDDSDESDYLIYLKGQGISTSAPVVSGISPTANPRPQWTWTVPVGTQNIRYKLNTQAWIVTDSSTIQSYIPDSDLPEGEHTLDVQAQDSSDYWSDSGSFVIHIDFSSPERPSVTSLEAVTQKARPTWNWTCPTGTGQFRYKLNNEDWITTDNTVRSFSPGYDLEEGNHILEVQAGDEFGNWSSSGSISVIIDITSPEQPLIDGQILTNDSTPTWNWNLPAGTEYFRYRLNNQTPSGSIANDIRSYTSPSNLSEGTHIFYIQASDLAGNWSDWSNFSTQIDLTAPSKPVVSGPLLTNDPSPRWSWTNPPETSDIRIRLDNGTWATMGNSSTLSFVPNSPLAHGDHILEVQAQDSSLNWSESGSFTITIDLESPNAPDVYGESYTTDTTPGWNWTIPEDTVDMRYSINNGEWTETGGVHITSFIAENAMGEGSYLFQVQALDNAGNWSENGEYTTVIDLTPPDSPTLTSQRYTNDTTPTISWVMPEQGIRDVRYKFSQSSSFESINWTVLGSGSILSFTPDSSLVDDLYFFWIQICDSAGNWSSSESFRIIEVDTLPLNKPYVSGPSVTSSPRPVWELSMMPDGTDVIRYRINGGDWIETDDMYNRTYTPDSDLSPGTYLFELQVSDRAGNWSATANKTTTVEMAAPNAPVITECLNNSANVISLSWAAGSGTETGYVLEKRIGSGNYTIILNGTTDTSYEDSDVEELTDYSYRVKAQNEVGESPYSSEFPFTFPLFTPVLNVPDQWDESHYGFALTWQDYSENETSYVLERLVMRTDSDYSVLATIPSGTLSYVDSDVPENSFVRYRLQAVRDTGEESSYSVDSGRTVVRSPENPAISDWLYRGDITVSWNDDSLVETNYRIYGKYNSGDAYSLLAELPADTEEYVFDNSSVINDYYFMIYACIVDGDGSYIASNQIETDLSQIPLKPILSMNSANINGGVRISWGAEYSSPYEGFTLERREGYDGEYSVYRDLTPGLRSYDDTGLDPGQTYFYRITGYTNDYRTSYLEEQIQYLETIADPTGLTVNNVTGTSAEISWSDQSHNETGFLIERKIGSGGTYSQVGTVSANTTIFTDRELDPEIQYYYRVRAQNYTFGIYSNYSNVLNIFTNPLPQPPEELKASVTDDILLNWKYSAGAIDGYIIQRFQLNTLEEEFSVDDTTMSFTDSGLPAGESYTYKVFAFDGNGNSKGVSITVTTIPEGAVALEADSQWHEFDLAGNGDEDWFYFYVQESDIYQITWDDSYLGSGSCTADIQVSVFHKSVQDESPFFINQDLAYSVPAEINCASAEIIYIKVNGKTWSESGTFRIGIVQTAP